MANENQYPVNHRKTETQNPVFNGLINIVVLTVICKYLLGTDTARWFVPRQLTRLYCTINRSTDLVTGFSL